MIFWILHVNMSLITLLLPAMVYMWPPYPNFGSWLTYPLSISMLHWLVIHSSRILLNLACNGLWLFRSYGWKQYQNMATSFKMKECASQNQLLFSIQKKKKNLQGTSLWLNIDLLLKECIAWYFNYFATSYKIINPILMGQCKKDVTTLLMHCSYILLALSHEYDIRQSTWHFKLRNKSMISTGFPQLLKNHLNSDLFQDCEKIIEWNVLEIWKN